MDERSILQAARRHARRWAWAKARSRQQLESLEAFADPMFGGLFDTPYLPWGPADDLAATVLGAPMSEATTRRFWSGQVRLPTELLPALDDHGFVHAFLDAALEAWFRRREQFE